MTNPKGVWTGRVYVETVPGCDTVRSVTIVAKNGVYYAVEREETGQWVEIWSEVVRAGRDKAHRVSGFAFTSAAATQENELRKAVGR